MLDWWSYYTVTIVWGFAWVDSALVVLDEWLSYRSDHLNRFDCIVILYLTSVTLQINDETNYKTPQFIIGLFTPNI